MAKKPGTIYEEHLMDTRDHLVGWLCVDKGMSVTDVGIIFRISKQRVSQILKANKKIKCQIQ